MQYCEALKNCKAIFEIVEKLKMPKLTLLNIGGGFSMFNDECFMDLGRKLSRIID